MVINGLHRGIERRKCGYWQLHIAKQVLLGHFAAWNLGQHSVEEMQTQRAVLANEARCVGKHPMWSQQELHALTDFSVIEFQRRAVNSQKAIAAALPTLRLSTPWCMGIFTT